MEKRFIKPNKEEIKKDFASYKRDFQLAVRDKKRWITCLIELAIMCAFLAVDLLTKHFVYGKCESSGDIIIIDGVIRFTAVRNTGASFGIFKDATVALTAMSAICVVILILFIFYSYPRRNLWLRSALILICAGALGNVIDRMVLGYVRDMVYFELINFAVFNFADSCLTVGTVVLIIYILFFYGKDEEEARKKRESEAANNINATKTDEATVNTSEASAMTDENAEGSEVENEESLTEDGAEQSAEESAEACEAPELFKEEQDSAVTTENSEEEPEGAEEEAPKDTAAEAEDKTDGEE